MTIRGFPKSDLRMMPNGKSVASQSKITSIREKGRAKSELIESGERKELGLINRDESSTAKRLSPPTSDFFFRETKRTCIQYYCRAFLIKLATRRISLSRNASPDGRHKPRRLKSCATG